MRDLPEIGNIFFQYFYQFAPEFVEGFNPGISRSKIQEILGAMEYSLPEDFYTLYEWRNGYSEFNGHPNFNFQSFAPLHFNSIEILAVERAWEWCDDSPPKYKGYDVLPLVSSGRVFWGITLGRHYSNEAHIVYIDTVGDCVLRYDSITSIFNSVVEGFNSRALVFDEDKIIRKDNKLFSKILMANNPKVLSESVLDFERNIDIYGSDSQLDNAIYKSRVNSLLNSLSTLHHMRPPEIVERIHRKILSLENLRSSRAVAAHEGLERWLSQEELIN